MSTEPTDPVATTPQGSRVLAATLMSALVVLGLVVVFAVPADDLFAAPPLWVPVAQIAAGLAIHAALDAIGYRTPALRTDISDTDAAAQAMARWQSGMMLRFALSESVALVSLAAAFVLTEGGFVTYVIGAVISLALLALHVWPGSRPVGKMADALERDGKRSGLREAFGTV